MPGTPDDNLRLTECPRCRYDLTGLPKQHACPECRYSYRGLIYCVPMLQANPLERYIMICLSAVGFAFILALVLTGIHLVAMAATLTIPSWLTISTLARVYLITTAFWLIALMVFPFRYPGEREFRVLIRDAGISFERRRSWSAVLPYSEMSLVRGSHTKGGDLRLTVLARVSRSWNVP